MKIINLFAADIERILRAAANHILDKSNPHAVTAEQTGAYSKADADALLYEKIQTESDKRKVEIQSVRSTLFETHQGYGLLKKYPPLYSGELWAEGEGYYPLETANAGDADKVEITYDSGDGGFYGLRNLSDSELTLWFPLVDTTFCNMWGETDADGNPVGKSTLTVGVDFYLFGENEDVALYRSVGGEPYGEAIKKGTSFHASDSFESSGNVGAESDENVGYLLILPGGADCSVQNLQFITDDGMTHEMTGITGMMNDKAYREIVEQIDKKADAVKGVDFKNGNTITGEGNKAVGRHNTVSGLDNSVGSRSFHILSYTGTHGGNGTYTVDGTEADAEAIRAALAAGTVLHWSCENNMHYDYGGRITAASVVDNGIRISVTGIYTNAGKKAYPGYPALSESIAAGTAYFSVCELPELGSFVRAEKASADGRYNAASGYASHASGSGNKVVGDYGSAFGRENVAGYDTHVFGRFNKAGNAQDTFVNGLENQVDSLADSVFVSGLGLKSSHSYQLVTGKYNRNDGRNLLEIGGGTDDGHRENAYDVDKDGRTASHGKYQPGTLLFSHEVTDGKQVYRLTNGSTALGMRAPNALNQTVRTNTSAASRYYGYVFADAGVLGLENGKPYVMFVSFTANNADKDLSDLEVRGVNRNTAEDREIPNGLVFTGIQSGYNLAAIVFVPESGYNKYGMYFDDIAGHGFDLTVQSVFVQKLTFLTDDIPVYIKSTPRDKPMIFESDGRFTGAIASDDTDFVGIPIVFQGKLWAADYAGRTGYTVTRYARSGYVEDVRAELQEQLTAVRDPHISPTVTKRLETAGWYRIASKSVAGTADGGFLILTRGYNASNAESYVFAFTQGHKRFTLSPISCDVGNQHFTKLRYIYNDDKTPCYIEVYYAFDKANMGAVSVISNTGTYTSEAFTAGGIPDGYSVKEFDIPSVVETFTASDKAALDGKVDAVDIFEDTSFSWTDFTYSASESAGATVEASHISAASSSPITIHCTGETLGFTATISVGSYYKLKINGEIVFQSNSGDSYTGETVSYTLPLTRMTEDIVIELSASDMHFSGMERKKTKFVPMEQYNALLTRVEALENLHQ